MEASGWCIWFSANGLQNCGCAQSVDGDLLHKLLVVIILKLEPNTVPQPVLPLSCVVVAISLESPYSVTLRVHKLSIVYASVRVLFTSMALSLP